MESYICSGAKIRCSCGEKSSNLVVYPERTVSLTSEPLANENDYFPNKNIFSFGKCFSQGYPPTAQANHPMQCYPGTIFRWCQCKYDVLARQSPVLTTESFCLCQWGGKITFVDDGQTESNYDIDRDPTMLLEGMVEKTEELAEDVEEITKDIVENWTWLDSVELVPVVGSIVGMGREGMNGNWGMVALNAGFLVADVAGIISFGSTTALSTAGRAALKTGIKASTKTIAKQASKEVAKKTAEASTPKLLELTMKSHIAEQAVKKTAEASTPKLLELTMKSHIAEQAVKKVAEVSTPNLLEESLKFTGKESTKSISKKSSQTVISQTGAKSNSRIVESAKEFVDTAGKVIKNEWEEFITKNELSSFFRNLKASKELRNVVKNETRKYNKLKNDIGKYTK